MHPQLSSSSTTSEDVYAACINAILKSSIHLVGTVTRREVKKLQLWHQQELAQKERELRDLWEKSVKLMGTQSSKLSASIAMPSFSSCAKKTSTSKRGNPFERKSSNGSRSSSYDSIYGSFAHMVVATQLKNAVTGNGNNGGETSQGCDLLTSSPTHSVSSTSTASTAIEELDEFAYTFTHTDSCEESRLKEESSCKNNIKRADVGSKRKKKKLDRAVGRKRKAEGGTLLDIPPQQEIKQVKKKLKDTAFEIDGFTYKIGEKYFISAVQDLNETGFDNVYKIRSFIKCSDDPDSVYVEIKQPMHGSLIYIRNLHWLHEGNKIRPFR